MYMLNWLQPLLTQQACVVIHVYCFLISTLEHTTTMSMDYTITMYYHPHAHLLPGGKMRGQRLQSVITANCQLFATSRTGTHNLSIARYMNCILTTL